MGGVLHETAGREKGRRKGRNRKEEEADGAKGHRNHSRRSRGTNKETKKEKDTVRDGVQNEAWIYETEGIVERLVEVMNGVWRGEGFSEENKAENYRGITHGIIICANFERKEEERDRRKGNGTG
jgi:hypothetical protein